MSASDGHHRHVERPDEDVVTNVAEEPAPEPTYTELDAADFTIELRTTKRQRLRGGELQYDRRTGTDLLV
ncbi:hypothetical protein [Streptomyces sp. NPDC006527]|uniref:hypothetical protein n=1 Tax=Streptomyces sp. NPDC006527 TaxID=3364749 RepID=UPI00368A9841